MSIDLSTRTARLLEIEQRLVETGCDRNDGPCSEQCNSFDEYCIPCQCGWLLAELTAAEARAEWQPLLREALVVVEAHGEEYSVGDLDERIRAFLAAAPEETR